MKELLEPIGQWLGGNWGWVIVVLGVFFEITPIKFSPITKFLGWIGKKLTGDIRIDLSDLRRDFDEQQMDTIRTTVLDFANSCMRNVKHTQEEFDHILDLNKKYKKLIEKYEIENEVYVEAYAFIKRVYRKRQDKHDFLTAPPLEPDEERETDGEEG